MALSLIKKMVIFNTKIKTRKSSQIKIFTTFFLEFQIGYTVVRALVSTYRTMATSNTEAASEPNMKISLALSNDLGHATTWKMKRLFENNDQKLENNGQELENNEDMEMENNGKIEKLNPFQDNIKLENSLFSEKLYFLATGEGCASIELKTSEESFYVEYENSIYEMALDANQDERGDLFLSMCLRYKVKSDLEKNYLHFNNFMNFF